MGTNLSYFFYARIEREVYCLKVFPVGLSIAWANKALFSIPGWFVHACRSKKYDCSTQIDVTS